MARNVQHYSSVALTYAQALLDLANEQKTAQAIGAELLDLRQVIASDPAFASFLSDPAVGRAGRTHTLETVLKTRVSPLVYNLLGVMNEKNRMGFLSEVAIAFDALLQLQEGKIEVDVTTATPISAEVVEQIRSRVAEVSQREPVVTQGVDPSIIGGMRLRIGDKLIDASVKYQLEAMKEQLLAAKPK